MYAGETFIQEHANAILQDKRITLGWAFWQISRTGALAPPVKGLEKCVGLFNSNRSSALKKSIVKLKHLNRQDSYQRELIRQIRNFKPDIVHFQFASLAIQHQKVMQYLDIPFTFSVRGADVQTYPQTITGYVEKLSAVADKAAGIHTVCDHLKSLLFSYCGQNDKTVTIRTAINDRWKSIKRQPIKGRIVMVGRLHWRKGIPDLLVACRYLRDLGIDFSLVIVGEGEQRPCLEYMIRDLALSDFVSLVGRKTGREIEDYFSQAEVFVLSSLAEGFPNVVGEAMLARVPVIATHHAMLQEVFEPGVEFLQAETGNPASLADALMNLRQLNNVQRKAMTDQAFNRAASQFNYARHTDEFYLFWSDAIKNTR